MKRTLAIWLPNWPIQRLLRQRNERALDEQSTLVLQQRARQGQFVVAASASAWEMGVRPEMSVAEAKSLVRKEHAQLLIRDYDSVADRAALEKLAMWAHQFSPLAGVDDREPPETLLLNIHPAAAIGESEQQLIDKIRGAFQRFRLHTRLGVACTVGAAWAAAHFGRTNPAIIPHGKHPEWIGDLPMKALRISDSILNQLDRLGLRQVGQLFPLPRTAMQSRFGNELLRRLDQALGTTAELIQAVQPSPEFQTEWQFENPIEHRPSIDHTIQQLVERLCKKLRDHQRGALQITCHLTCQDGSRKSVNAGMFRPSAAVVHLWQLLNMHLERITLSAAVTKIVILASVHETFDDEQTPMFDQPTRQHRSAIVGSVMDRIAGRLGRDAVVRCRFREDAQPERAVQLQPIVGGSSSPTVTTKREGTNQPGNRHFSYSQRWQPLDRPLHLFSSPIAIEAHRQVKGGPVCKFVWRGDDYPITKLWGPERIETGWWRNKGIRRDYYRVETNTGHRYWLFRCLRSNHWYLHGVFD